MDYLIQLVTLDLVLMGTIVGFLFLANLLISTIGVCILAPALILCEKKTFQIADQKHIKF